jgi:hypothetical protein
MHFNSGELISYCLKCCANLARGRFLVKLTALLTGWNESIFEKYIFLKPDKIKNLNITWNNQDLSQ